MSFRSRLHHVVVQSQSSLVLGEELHVCQRLLDGHLVGPTRHRPEVDVFRRKPELGPEVAAHLGVSVGRHGRVVVSLKRRFTNLILPCD